MKKGLMRYLVFVLILSIFLQVSYAAIGPEELVDNPSLAVTLVNQDPDPSEPGSYVDVRFKISNNGLKKAENVEVELIPEYPFSLDPGKKALVQLGNLQSRQKDEEGIILRYRLRVDENAIEGDNELRLRYRYNGNTWIEPDEFLIAVQTHDAILSIDAINVAGKVLEQGKTSAVSIRLSNKADSVLKDVNVKLGLSGLPFVTLDSSNEKSIYQIKSRTNADITFNLLTTPEGSSGVYSVPLEVSYADELGKVYIKNGSVGLIVGAKPDISTTIDSTEIYESGKTGEITLKVVNKGVTDIKFANLKLNSNNEIRIISSEEVYLGNIDSDDFETASFNIFTEKTSKESVQIHLNLKYMDANNNEFKETITLNLNLYSTSDAKKFGLKEGKGSVGNIIVIIIIVAGLYFYRKYRKKKKKA